MKKQTIYIAGTAIAAGTILLLLRNNKSRFDVDDLTVSSTGIEAIKKHEGLRLTAYPDGKNFSIGYGHNAADIYEGQTITKADAVFYLKNDLKNAENAIKQFVKVPLSQNEFDALVSLIYNIGSGNFLKSSILSAINSNRYSQAANSFLKFIYANNRINEGLQVRRSAERKLFLT